MSKAAAAARGAVGDGSPRAPSSFLRGGQMLGEGRHEPVVVDTDRATAQVTDAELGARLELADSLPYGLIAEPRPRESWTLVIRWRATRLPGSH